MKLVKVEKNQMWWLGHPDRDGRDPHTLNIQPLQNLNVLNINSEATVLYNRGYTYF